MTTDGEQNRIRGFPAFARQRTSRRFARTWWGHAWIRALEDTSLDQALLTRGRAYARAGRVGPITVSPGRIAALVQDDHDTPYQAVVQVERLTSAQWERLLDEIAARSGHIAALLDNEMPRDVATAAEDAAVPLLPGIGDLEPDCACPDWGHPCKHAAALCYQASWLLDEDPFVLLLMRGRGRRELLEELQHRTPRTGTPAAEAYALPLRPLPAPRPLPPLPVTGSEPAEGLAALAAQRARALLESSLRPGPDDHSTLQPGPGGP
jgi:uncharacterized Zn finger protein